MAGFIIRNIAQMNRAEGWMPDKIRIGQNSHEIQQREGGILRPEYGSKPPICSPSRLLNFRDYFGLCEF